MADSIPISEISLARLRELARWTGVSLDAALNQAIKDQCDRKFWDAANAGYAALHADPAAWAELEQERRSLEGTLMDGLEPGERANDDTCVPPPARQGSAS
jgi:hypothetical protein